VRARRDRREKHFAAARGTRFAEGSDIKRY